MYLEWFVYRLKIFYKEISFFLIIYETSSCDIEQVDYKDTFRYCLSDSDTWETRIFEAEYLLTVLM